MKKQELKFIVVIFLIGFGFLVVIQLGINHLENIKNRQFTFYAEKPNHLSVSHICKETEVLGVVDSKKYQGYVCWER